MSDQSTARPNIIFITVDEMRYPMVFPAGIDSPEAFLAKFMPNLHGLWQKGVKFSRFYTAAADCSPARGTIATGLYAYQTYQMCTLANPNNPDRSIQPSLNRAFPTYGKLLREAGYDTPFVGKWHLSNTPLPTDKTAPLVPFYLNSYGFDGMTIPDPTGLPGQGAGDAQQPDAEGLHVFDDNEIAQQAAIWLKSRAASNNPKPFCLTVSFVNPHDKQFFWGGTEAGKFNAVYKTIDEDPPLPYGITPTEAIPAEYGYALPDNWQSEADLEREVEAGRKPKMHQVFRQVSDHNVGGISSAETQTEFSTAETPIAEGQHKAIAPYRYWTRALDLYTKVMADVDSSLGKVLDNIPESLADSFR